MARKHRQAPWRKDPRILSRLSEVEKLHLAGWPNTGIATKLGVDEGTIRNDLKRVNELWLERVSGTTAQRKAQRLAELQDIRGRAVKAAEWDEQCERAVLLDEPIDGKSIHHDDKGGAQFRGNKAAALSVARQATMDAAKLEGLVVEKKSLTDEEGHGLDLAGILSEADEIINGRSGNGEPRGPTSQAPA